jgi:hypothetical protein
MATEKNEKLDLLIKQLDEGVKNYINTDRYKEYLNAMSKFNCYSANNIMLILQQNPNATLVAGYGAWKKIGRAVNRGEKGIGIIAPIKRYYYVNKNENPSKEINLKDDKIDEKKDLEKKEYVDFTRKTIFDISQTFGKDLPELAPELEGHIDNYNLVLYNLKQISPVSVYFEDIKNGSKGSYNKKDKKIIINKGMSDKQTVKTLIHEISHAIVHSSISTQKSKETKEVEAESIAYIVCNNFGLDTSEYSFPYITAWSHSTKKNLILESLDTIKKTSTELIESIENREKIVSKFKNTNKENEMEMELAR